MTNTVMFAFLCAVLASKTGTHYACLFLFNYALGFYSDLKNIINFIKCWQRLATLQLVPALIIKIIDVF